MIALSGTITVAMCGHGYSTVPLGNPAVSTMIPYSTQSHYPDTEPTSPCPIWIMLSTWLGSDKYQFSKSLVWLDQGSNSRSPAHQASPLPIRIVTSGFLSGTMVCTLAWNASDVGLIPNISAIFPIEDQPPQQWLLFLSGILTEYFSVRYRKRCMWSMVYCATIIRPSGP